MSGVTSSFEVLPVSVLEDTGPLLPVLLGSVIDSQTGEIDRAEVNEVLRAAEQSRRGTGDSQYFVAVQANNDVVGLMGLSNPDEDIRQLAITGSAGNPAELINAYVDPRRRARGVGKALVDVVIANATEQGHDELLVASGPRFMHTGWPFWDHLFGPNVGIAHNYFENQYPAIVWSKLLGEDTIAFRAAVPNKFAATFRDLARSRWPIQEIS